MTRFDMCGVIFHFEHGVMGTISRKGESLDECSGVGDPLINL